MSKQHLIVASAVVAALVGFGSTIAVIAAAQAVGANPAALIGLGLPLFLMTLAFQNLPGFIDLRAPDVPMESERRSISLLSQRILPKSGPTFRSVALAPPATRRLLASGHDRPGFRGDGAPRRILYR